MRGLIGFYGDAMQELVSPNLERSMETLKLARLLPEKAPFYVGTELREIWGERVAHRLLIPMSDVGRPITHCLLMSV